MKSNHDNHDDEPQDKPQDPPVDHVQNASKSENAQNQSYKTVIIAGGSGTRLWPLSTQKKPKQFQALAGEKSMLRETYDRLLMSYEVSDIYVSTGSAHADLVQEQIPELPSENIIVETALRDTASAIALICAVIDGHTPGSIVSVFPSDHVITNPELLTTNLKAAEDFIVHNPEHILTFGITPTAPEVGYGYIKKGSEISQFTAGGRQAVKDAAPIVIYEAQKFVEKPDYETALTYVDSGEYYWNAGMFVFNTRSMIEEYAKYVPDTHKRLVAIRESVGTQEYHSVLTQEYGEMDKISIDYAIMENAQHIAVLPIDLHWSDVGNWVALKQVLVPEAAEHLSRGRHIDFNSENIVVYPQGSTDASKPVVTVGLKDIVVIDTPEATLVCAQSEAANLSKYVKEMGAGEHSDLL